jgi:hypothetical protein
LTAQNTCVLKLRISPASSSLNTIFTTSRTTVGSTSRSQKGCMD